MNDTQLDARRFVAAGVISLVGAGLLFPNVIRLLEFGDPLGEVVLAAVGTLLSAVLILVGSLLFREPFTLPQLLRITLWAVVGAVLFGVILGLIVSSGVDPPIFAVATLLSAGVLTHVLIGVKDVQHIRATEVAQNAERFSVLNRLLRHNLHHETERLRAAESRIAGAASDEARDEALADVRAVVDTLSGMETNLDRIEGIVEGRVDTESAVDLADVVETVAVAFRSDHPEATITVDVPSGVRVTGGTQIRLAIAELVENAIVHAGDASTVEITATTTSGGVRLEVVDDGPGIDDAELSVLNREATIDQLDHSQGLGLWFVRWVMDVCGGEFYLESDESGTTAILGIPDA
ncbi:MAG: HAMP domain-containing sensor histidine kinase [Natronomonas sp.]